MNQDYSKLSDEQLEEEIKKVKGKQKKAIDQKDKVEEKRYQIILNDLQEEKLDRKRRGRTENRSAVAFGENEAEPLKNKDDSYTRGRKRDFQEEDDDKNNEREETAEPNSSGTQTDADEIVNRMRKDHLENQRRSPQDHGSADAKKKGNLPERNDSNFSNKPTNSPNTSAYNPTKDSVGAAPKANVGGTNAVAGSETVAGGTATSGAAATGGTATSGAAATGAATSGTAGGAAATGAGATTTAAAATTATPVGWVILITVAVILLIIMIIGLIGFFFTMPSLVQGRLMEFRDKLFDGIVGFLGADRAKVSVKEEDVLEVANYLESMGISLKGYGFLSTNDASQKLTEQQGEQKAVTILDGSDLVLQKDTQGTITSVDSKYIMAYLANHNLAYMIANDDFSLPHIFSSFLKHPFTFNVLTAGGYITQENKEFGRGMIVLDGVQTTYPTGGSIVEELMSWIQSGWDEMKHNYFSNIKIDRQSNTMVVETLQNFWRTEKVTYTYDLDGWTGLYGKPVEFLLALHLATMAPDFALQVATDQNIETKVHIQFHPVVHATKLYKDFEGNDEVQVGDYDVTEEQLEEYGKQENVAYKPYITQVEKHWYQNLDFSHCYKLIGEDQKMSNGIVTHTYTEIVEEEVEVEVEVEDDEGNVYTETHTEIEEREVERTVDFYSYNIISSDIVQRANPKKSDNSKYIREMLTKNKYYTYDGIRVSDEPKLLVDPGSGVLALDKNSKNVMFAIALLENVDTQDAKAILKMFKELLNDYGADFPIDEGSQTDDSKQDHLDKEMEESIPNYSENEEGQDVLSPWNGNIVQIDKESITIEVGMLTNKKKYLYYNFKVDESLTTGEIKQGDKLGTTIKGKKPAMIVKDSEGNIQGESEAGQITRRTDVNNIPKASSVGELQIKLSSYNATLGSMAEAFYEAQERYGVSATFLASIAVAESGGGTNWSLIDPSSNNIFSIMGSYNGESYTDRNGTKWKKYPSVRDAILDAASLLRNNYLSQGINSIEAIGKTYEGGSSYWYDTVTWFCNKYKN